MAVRGQVSCTHHAFSPFKNLGCSWGDRLSQTASYIRGHHKDLEHYTLTQLTNQERTLRTGNVEANPGDAPVGSTSGRECAKALGWKNT